MFPSDEAMPEGERTQRADSLWARVGNFKVPRILPEEHVLAWCGRMHRINDVHKPVGENSSYRSFLPFKLPGLADVAILAGMDTEGMLRRHTMIPFVRAVVPDSTFLDSDGRRNVSTDVTPKLAARWGALRYCSGCVARDRRKHGFAYWRRIHQLPGVFWCPWHKTSLVSCTDKTTYIEEPGDHLVGVDASLGLWPSYSETPPAVRTYMHLAVRTLLKPHPIGSSSMAIRLNAMAHAFMPTGGEQGGMTQRLKTSVEEAFPMQWLAKVSPQRIGVGRGEAPAEWKTLLYVWPRPRATERYLIVATALNPDEGIVSSILFGQEHEYWVPDADHRGPSAPSHTWVLSAARRLAKFIEAREEGAPFAAASSSVRQAFVTFLNGRSLEESCSLSQADPKALQEFLRERLLLNDMNQ